MLLQEKDYLELYKKQSEHHLGWGNSAEWTNQDFEKLSELIFEKTAVRLSASTLKRVWGKVKYDSAPTLTTLNALAQFSGYESWRNFRTTLASQQENKNGNGSHNGAPPAIEAIPAPIKKKNKAITRRMGIGISAAVVVTGFLIYLLTGFSSGIDLSKITFDAMVVSDELPNSVVFSYDGGTVNTDSLIIQQSWDPKRRETVSARLHQHTSIYYFPGFFKAKLMLGDKILKEHDLLIKTDGWKGIINQETVPAYLSKDEIKLAGNSMSIDAETLTNKTGKTVFNEVWTDFNDIREFSNVTGDEFTFLTLLQNTSSKEQAVCQKVRVTLLGSEGFITLPLCSRGCTSAISAYVGSDFISGKDTDLAAFGCDFTKPQELKCELKSKKVSVFLNGENVFSHDIQTGLGKIVGMTISFEGTGKIWDAKIM